MLVGIPAVAALKGVSMRLWPGRLRLNIDFTGLDGFDFHIGHFGET